jgi:hypothetical protein
LTEGVTAVSVETMKNLGRLPAVGFREMPGWSLRLLDDGLHGGPHTVMITTPTGHRYTSAAPQPP